MRCSRRRGLCNETSSALFCDDSGAGEGLDSVKYDTSSDLLFFSNGILCASSVISIENPRAVSPCSTLCFLADLGEDLRLSIHGLKELWRVAEEEIVLTQMDKFLACRTGQMGITGWPFTKEGGDEARPMLLFFEVEITVCTDTAPEQRSIAVGCPRKTSPIVAIPPS